MTRLACPHCGSTNLAMLVEVPATLNGTFTRDETGDVEFDPENHYIQIDHPHDATEIGWHCNGCHNESADPWYEELVPVRRLATREEAMEFAARFLPPDEEDQNP